MIFGLPAITKEQAEIFATFPDDTRWEYLARYLGEAKKLVAAQFKPDSTRDADQILKGMMLVLDTIIMLPFDSREVLNPPAQEEELPPLDERPISTKEEVK